MGYEVRDLEAVLQQYNLSIPFNTFDHWTQFQVLIEDDATISNCFVSAYTTIIISFRYLYSLFLLQIATIELCVDKVSNNATKSITNY